MHILILTLLTLHALTTTLAYPHLLPLHQRTTHSSHKYNFIRSSIHFPQHSHISNSVSKFRSLLPASFQNGHEGHKSLFPSHDQRRVVLAVPAPLAKANAKTHPVTRPKAIRDPKAKAIAAPIPDQSNGGVATSLAKPFSYSIWRFLSSPGTLVNSTTSEDGNSVGGIGGSVIAGSGNGEPTAAQLSIFKGNAVGKRFMSRFRRKARRAVGFLGRRSEEERGIEGRGESRMGTGQAEIGRVGDEEGIEVGGKMEGSEVLVEEKAPEIKTETYSKTIASTGSGKDHHRHTYKPPTSKTQTQLSPPPKAPLRISMENFASLFSKMKDGEDSLEESGSGNQRGWFGWGR